MVMEVITNAGGRKKEVGKKFAFICPMVSQAYQYGGGKELSNETGPEAT